MPLGNCWQYIQRYKKYAAKKAEQNCLAIKKNNNNNNNQSL